MWKRNQSMMAEMAKFDFIDKVIFVNPDISLRQMLKQTKKNGNKGFLKRFFFSRVHQGVWNYTLFHVLPVSIQNKVFERIESRWHLHQLLRLNENTPFILFMNCPNSRYPYPLDELLKIAELSIFDLSDDFIELVHNNQGKALYSHNIKRYLSAADLALAVNGYLKNKYTPINTNIHIIKNATNYSNFDRKKYRAVPLLDNMKSEKKPIIGYSGICNISRIDVVLLDFLLRNRPDWQYVFIGPKGEELTAHVGNYMNFNHLHAVKYERLPDHLNYFQVAIVPFKINDHTKGNNLLKFHDYLAMGKPVVTTNIGGAEDFEGLVRIAGTPADFLIQIEQALAADSPDLILQRKRVAFDNSWPNRIKEVEQLLSQYLTRN